MNKADWDFVADTREGRFDTDNGGRTPVKREEIRFYMAGLAALVGTLNELPKGEEPITEEDCIVLSMLAGELTSFAGRLSRVRRQQSGR